MSSNFTVVYDACVLYLAPVQFARAHDANQQFLTSDSNCSSD